MDDINEIRGDKVFICEECGYTTVDEEEIKLKKCPECGGKLKIEKFKDETIAEGFSEETFE
ncbi:hypothetical protein COT51_02015 [candidate division WWE3 bacterium CG08_land_8_20_14_0_20_41_15]|uniref:Uncharacterized protein n=1 Tax=candidate division WWE3 bacterium CG08_land_8_20_14_0_20_41_15 TaxID=1975086 RepID=A0A2H0XBM0_UNCKA|nr:MAG: hypothetical protein COT51_02015 [candidate division WWE3 bacterium CG08_land_8_20_14_0_20_41_15]